MGQEYIANLVAEMTLEEKIGAVLTLGFAGVVPQHHVRDYIEKYHCGGLRLSPEMRMFGKYVDPNSNKTVVDVTDISGQKYDVPPTCTAEEYRDLIEDLQSYARNRRLSIPLHFSFDQEGGTSSDGYFSGVSVFPKPMGLVATGDKKYSYLAAKAIAEQAKTLGMNWIHSPVLDINLEPSNPEIVTRAYSDDPQVTTEYAAEACRGFKAAGVIATAKHFPGRGRSVVDAHFTIPRIEVDKKTLMETDLLPYRELIKQDLLPAIMIAHSIYPAIDPDHIATVSKKVITGLLREELGYKGVICTDSMTMGGVIKQYGVGEACAMALEAGADLVLMKAENHLVEETIQSIMNYVRIGKITEDELNKKVYRILKTKYDYGLFENNPFPRLKDDQKEDIKKLAKEIAEKSVLVEANKDGLIPLSKEQKFLVVEQKIKNYNDYNWHSGILYEACRLQGLNADYLEVDYTYDEADKTRIKSAAEKYDVLLITNYYLRTKKGNKDFLDDFAREYTGKIILVTNTPYKEISILERNDNCIITFSSAPENIKVVARVLSGDCKAEGKWPLKK